MVAARRLRRLGRARRGAAGLQFAIVAIPFLLVILLTFEIAWQTAVSAALDSGLREAGRWAALGTSPQGGGSREQEVLRIVGDGAGMPLSGPLTIRVSPLPGMAAAATAPRGCCAGGSGDPCAGNGEQPSTQGGAGRVLIGALAGSASVVRYEVTYESPGLSPVGRALLPRAMLTHCAVLLTTNEPYPGS